MTGTWLGSCRVGKLSPGFVSAGAERAGPSGAAAPKSDGFFGFAGADAAPVWIGVAGRGAHGPGAGGTAFASGAPGTAGSVGTSFSGGMFFQSSGSGAV